MTKACTEDQIKDTWHLNLRNCEYWDAYMALHVLQWLSTKNVFNPESLRSEMKKLLGRTLLVDFYPIYTGENPSEGEIAHATKMKEKFLSIEHSLEDFISCIIAIGKACQKTESVEPATVKEWQLWWNNQRLNENQSDYGDSQSYEIEVKFPENAVTMLLEYCKLFYEFGDYKLCIRWLLFFLDNICAFVVEARENYTIKSKCLWGIIASMNLSLPTPENLLQTESNTDTDEYYVLAKYFLMLIEINDLHKNSRQESVISQIWLIYWILWPLLRFYLVVYNLKNISYVTSVDGCQDSNLPFSAEWNRVIEWLLSEQILMFISSTCPHLFRYIAVITILSKNRQEKFEQTIEFIAKTAFRYSDIFTSMLESLFVNYNFEDAQEKLAYCRAYAESDFLLAPLAETIEEHARLLIFQTYCRIQKSIDIDMIAKKLHMSADIAEKWIVNLIRHTRLEAKIDSEKNCVEIASPSTSIYQQILEKTQNVMYETEVLLRDLQRKNSLNIVTPVQRVD